MRKCRRHKQKTYQIKKLYPNNKFSERLLYLSECAYCKDFILHKVYTRLDGSKWTQKVFGNKAKQQYEDLIPIIMCDYTLDLHPELDIGLNYLEGKDFSIRKIHNAAVTDGYIPPDMQDELYKALLTLLTFRSIKNKIENK